MGGLAGNARTALVGLGVGIALGVGGAQIDLGKTIGARLPDAGTPPAEYVYLDTSRVLSYLGQVEGGLSKSEKRTLGLTQTTTAGISAGTAAQLSASSQRQLSSQETVAPSVADRFYRFLRWLSIDPGGDGFRTGRWFYTVDAQLSPAHRRNQLQNIQYGLRPAEEGLFVRILHARLCVPDYAAVLPKLAYVPVCNKPTHRPSGAISLRALLSRNRSGVKDYLRRLGKNPRVPLIVQTLTPNRRTRPQNPVTFLLPIQYRQLTVGKVAYTDLRVPPIAVSDPRPQQFVDRESIAQYVPALMNTSRWLPATLRTTRSDAARRVSQPVTLHIPVVVLTVIAIYQ